jgi:hypothetical protein
MSMLMVPEWVCWTAVGLDGWLLTRFQSPAVEMVFASSPVRVGVFVGCFLARFVGLVDGLSVGFRLGC